MNLEFPRTTNHCPKEWQPLTLTWSIYPLIETQVKIAKTKQQVKEELGLIKYTRVYFSLLGIKHYHFNKDNDN